MNEQSYSEIAAWLTQAGLAGETENTIVDGFCERCVEAGLPVARAHVFIDTLDPVHEGRLFRWGHAETEKALQEYGRLVRTIYLCRYVADEELRRRVRRQLNKG